MEEYVYENEYFGEDEMFDLAKGVTRASAEADLAEVLSAWAKRNLKATTFTADSTDAVTIFPEAPDAQ